MLSGSGACPSTSHLLRERRPGASQGTPPTPSSTLQRGVVIAPCSQPLGKTLVQPVEDGVPLAHLGRVRARGWAPRRARKGHQGREGDSRGPSGKQLSGERMPAGLTGGPGEGKRTRENAG